MQDRLQCLVRRLVLAGLGGLFALLSGCTLLPAKEEARPAGPPNLILQLRDPDIARVTVQVRPGDGPTQSYAFDAKDGAIVGPIHLAPRSGNEVTITALAADGKVIYRGTERRDLGAAAAAFAMPLRAEGGRDAAIAHFTTERFSVSWVDEGAKRIVTPRLLDPTGKEIPFKLEDIRYGLNDVRRFPLIPRDGGKFEIVTPAPLPELCVEIFLCVPGGFCEATQLCNPWTRIAAGGEHSCGITKSGAAFCWGRNADGELGSATTATCLQTPCSPTPVPVACPTGAPCRFIDIAASETRSCAIDDKGDAWCWGFGSTNKVRLQAQLAGAAVKFKSITAGFGHVCALSDRGDVWCAGDNFFGQAGAARSTRVVPFNAPVRLFGASAFKKVVAGTNHTCAVSADGTSVACWGDNTDQQLVDIGQPFQAETGCTCTSRPVFRPLPFGPKVENIAAGTSGTCVTLSSGETTCWGFNLKGRGFPQTTPLDRLALGDVHACGISKGAGVCTGNGFFGQLGNGSNTITNAVVSVARPPQSLTEIAAGRAHTCGIGDDGRVYCWGRNELGQLGTGTATSAPSYVPQRVVRVP